jgi:hypothetical protein
MYELELRNTSLDAAKSCKIHVSKQKSSLELEFWTNKHGEVLDK